MHFYLLIKYPSNNLRLHYTWVETGTLDVSFLITLHVGSDLFWFPFDYIQSAPLSTHHGSLHEEQGIYNLDESKLSKPLACILELCTLSNYYWSSKQNFNYIN